MLVFNPFHCMNLKVMRLSSISSVLVAILDPQNFISTYACNLCVKVLHTCTTHIFSLKLFLKLEEERSFKCGI